MKITKHIQIFGILFFALSSCSVDTHPWEQQDEDTFFDDPNNIETATLGNYAILKEENFVKTFHEVGEYAGDNVSLSGTTVDPLIYIYNYHHITTSSLMEQEWILSYKSIGGCNKIIGKVKEGESEETDQLLGENYYLRSFLFLNLCNAYGRPYTQNPTQNLGIPLKLTDSIEEIPPRATVAEVYDQIEKDLLHAAELMTLSKENIYATKEAAWALLSRIYLYEEKNDKAIEFATKVIDSGRFSLLSTKDFPSYPTIVPEENSETIFAIKLIKDADYDGGWYTIGSMYNIIDGVGWGEMYASSSYLQLLDQHPEDVRHQFINPQYVLDANGKHEYWALWIDNNDNTSMYRNIDVTYNETEQKYYYNNNGVQTPVKEEIIDNKKVYSIIYEGKNTQVDIGYKMITRNGYPQYFINKCSGQEGQGQLWSPVISRLAEMYLNRAEANAKLGKDVDALNDINTIRSRAGLSGDALYNTSNLPSRKKVVDVVLEERRLELAYEGHRRFDVFRNKQNLNRKYPGIHLGGSAPLDEIKYTDLSVVQLIPQDEIFAQPNLIQNPTE